MQPASTRTCSSRGGRQGRYRMSLIYENPARASDGKSAPGTDTFQGRFVELLLR
jgi:hypothetical protein